MNDEAHKLFWSFVKEREAIRVRRAEGAKWPWTKNEVLRD